MKNRLKKKVARRQSVQKRVRKKVSGTGARPRLAIFRSNAHFYAQIIDDEQGQTLVAASTVEKAGRELKTTAERAVFVGETIAARATEKGLTTVVFDRSGYPYHGNVKLLAEKAREKGLQF
jgi:large subunit ribosomal protein L18